MNKFKKTIIYWIKIYVIGTLIAIGIAVAFWGYTSLSKAYQSNILLVHQVQYQDALTKQVGQPTTVIQKYESPSFAK